jgi:hypothetical protein
VTFSSGHQHVALIELFSSEGCSSCPPAERWLSGLRDEPRLWREFVPLSFHVDYWNRLGWTDRFSNHVYSARQSEYAESWGTSTVYTPCFVKDGEEWRTNRSLQSSRVSAGTLSAKIEGQTLVATYMPESGVGGFYEVHAALLGCGIVSKIASGENRGATLHHDFVVLNLVHGALGEDIHLNRSVRKDVPRTALAVWVSRQGELKPIQATGGWLE